jgi:hypothetical protein
MLKNVIIPNQVHKTHVCRNINKFTIPDFQMQLCYEMWQTENDVNCSFNNFLNTYLRLIDYSFLIRKVVNYRGTNNIWMRTGIRISRKKKKNFYLKYRNSNDENITVYYK